LTKNGTERFAEENMTTPKRKSRLFGAESAHILTPEEGSIYIPLPPLRYSDGSNEAKIRAMSSWLWEDEDEMLENSWLKPWCTLSGNDLEYAIEEGRTTFGTQSHGTIIKPNRVPHKAKLTFCSHRKTLDLASYLDKIASDKTLFDQVNHINGIDRDFKTEYSIQGSGRMGSSMFIAFVASGGNAFAEHQTTIWHYGAILNDFDSDDVNVFLEEFPNIQQEDGRPVFRIETLNNSVSQRFEKRTLHVH